MMSQYTLFIIVGRGFVPYIDGQKNDQITAKSTV